MGDAVQITGGEITGNTATNNGGGVCFYNSDLTISSAAKVANNKAAKGGGVFFQGNTLTISDSAQITDNTAAENGGGIYISKNKNVRFLLSGSINISGNKKSVGENASTPNNVYLPSGYVITLTGKLTNTQKIGVTTENIPSASCISITATCYDNELVSAAKDKFTYENDSSYSIVTRSNGKVLAVCDHVYDTTKWSSDETNHYHKCKNCDTTKDTAAHSYSSDWKTDNSKHWHECECGQKSGEAEHSYSAAWQRDDTSHFHECSACGNKKDITTCVYDQEYVSSNYRVSNATCTAKAVYHKSCVCDRAGTATFEYGEKNPNNHTGTLGNWQSNDDGHWKEYSCCRTKVQEGTHTWDEGKVTTPATCTAAGEKTFTCTACSATKKETIPATGHAWDTEWSKDNDHHWHECKNANCTEIADQAEHRWNEGEVTTPATCTADGVKTLTCTVCSATKKETIPATGHAWDTEWSKDNDHHWHECNNANCDAVKDKAEHSWNEGAVTTPATCTAAGEKTFTCTACSATKKETIPATGHAWDTEWSKDNDHHWHECNNANCDAVKDKAEHSWNEGAVTTPATCTAAGEKTFTCTACSATKKETIPATGHAWDTEWSKDNDHHWHKCKNCNAIDESTKAPHSWDNGTVTTPANCTADGEKTFTCTACSATKKETIPATGHAWDTEWSKDNDHHWHKCKNCDAITDLTAHVPGAAATETTPQLCTECGYVIAPATHPVHTWVFVAETPATCNAAGEREHYKCTCGRTSFKNGDAYDINEDASVLTIEKNSANHTGAPDSKWHSDSANHWQEYTCCYARANEAAHSGGAATCTAQAVCQVCGKAYGAALGHDWGAWKVTTPATKDAPGVETRTCTHNSAHTETRSIPKLSTTVYTVSEDTKIAQIEAKVDGLDKILELNENKALVNDGKSVGVSLTVKNTASSGVSEKIKEKLAGSNLVGLRLELTVEKTVTANGVVESKQTIPDAGVLLKTTITLPAELQGKSGYVVYRLHDENVHVLTETANENGEFISVSADKTQITICARLYSEYVIAYQTGGSSGGGYHPVNPMPVKATSANTGDAGVLLYGVTAVLSLTGTAWLGAKSRKH